MATYGNNRSLAARSLGIDRSTLRRKLAAMGEGDGTNDPLGKP
ncbi:MAG: helix-turn-helix domain-containing protein [Planctomycetota bacterium]